MRLRYVCTALILGGCTLSGSAQTGSISAKVAAGTQMSPVQAQEELLNFFEHEFMGVATANYYFASKILGEKMPVDPKSIQGLTTKVELLKAAADSFAYAHKALATITPENAYTTIEGVDGLHTRSVVASFISAHGFDHYGQMVEYLRMNGVVPPGSK